MEGKESIIKQVVSFFKTVHGVGTSILFIGSLAMLVRTSVINSYVKENKPLTNEEVHKIVKEEIEPVISTQVVMNGNIETLKTGLVTHMKKDTGQNNTDDIVNLLTGFKNEVMNELKKNENLNFQQTPLSAPILSGMN